MAVHSIAYTALYSAAMVGSRCASPKPTSEVNETRRSSATSTSAALGFGRKNSSWKCVEGCGACCKLDKGPCFPTPEEIFPRASDVNLYRSMIASDGWCVHYEKGTRTCSIYADRPYFCRVEPEIFKTLYGVPKKKFDKEACRDTIKDIYGPQSPELQKFKHATNK